MNHGMPRSSALHFLSIVTAEKHYSNGLHQLLEGILVLGSLHNIKHARPCVILMLSLKNSKITNNIIKLNFI